MPAPTLNYVPLTELDAVNEIIGSIGQAPVNTLAVSGITDVNTARLVLHNTMRDVLTRGWNFNTDEEYPLLQDANGKVAIPANVLSLDPTDKSLDYVERVDAADGDRRLYDRYKRTFVIGKDVPCTIKWFFKFEELPNAARAYITARAGRKFQARYVGSQILYQFTEQMELDAAALLQTEELSSINANSATGDPGSAYITLRDRMC